MRERRAVDISGGGSLVTYDYLAHHGIKGMKWGIRRWQNDDGSLTSAGYSHYGVNKPNTRPFYGGPKKNESRNAYDIGSSKMLDRVKKYKEVQGTRSLFGGDHRKDKSVQVLKEYQKDKERNKKYINDRVRKAMKKDPDSGKDAYKDAVGEVVDRHLKKYAAALLEDMGYNADHKSVDWLVKQGWLTMT